MSGRSKAENAIFHIAVAAAWDGTKRAYRPQAYDQDGFVHCSRSDQVMRVAQSRFAGRSDRCSWPSSALVGSVLRSENLEGGEELSPHVYGPVLVRSIMAVAHLRAGPDGRFVVPSDFSRRFRVAPC